MNKIKITALALCAAIVSGCFYGCKNPQREYPVNRDNLFGMDFIVYQYEGNGGNYVDGFRLMKNMGVKTMRNWMHFNLFFGDGYERKEEAISHMHEVLATASEYGITVVGLNHSNFNTSGCNTQKPLRDPSENSYYNKWLADYEKGWRLLASEFSEVTYWEIDNECNNVGFMPRLGGGTFTQKQMAAIFTDMMFYASRGIHSGNPSAISVMGGLTDASGFASGQTVNFMQYIYDNIASGEYGEGNTEPDSYFEVACWHPYSTSFDADAFVAYNDKIYDVVYRNEKKDKKVFFTEVGSWTNMVDEDVAARYVTELYETVRDRMPYVETVQFFRMMDINFDVCPNYGLFYDIDKTYSDNKIGTNERGEPGAPKKAALAYQRVAGGSGSLRLLCDGGNAS